eukprot:jgi/Mesvir1/6006/Mv00753-RA.1
MVRFIVQSLWRGAKIVASPVFRCLGRFVPPWFAWLLSLTLLSMVLLLLIFIGHFMSQSVRLQSGEMAARQEAMLRKYQTLAMGTSRKLEECERSRSTSASQKDELIGNLQTSLAVEKERVKVLTAALREKEAMLARKLGKGMSDASR